MHVRKPKLTGLTGFMFKQKQRANSANTHKHLCGHTLHARIVKCTEDSLIPFWVKHTQRCLAYSSMGLKTIHILSPSLSWGQSVLCLILFVPHIHRKTFTHTFVSFNSMMGEFMSLILNLRCQWADVRIKADGWGYIFQRNFLVFSLLMCFIVQTKWQSK